MPDANAKRWWRHLTPGRFLLLFLAGEGFLILSQRFGWFAFNRTKGWTVLMSIALAATALLIGVLWAAGSLILRRRFQFSVRSLLMLTVVIAIPCSWFTAHVKRARRQEAAAKALAAKGVYIAYDYMTDFRGRYVYAPDGQPIRIIEPPGPAWLRDWLGDDFFVSVSEVQCSLDFCDQDMAILEDLAGIQLLYLAQTQVSDVGLQHLAGQAKLETLLLWRAKVTDAGMEELAKLHTLKHLDLADTQITDNGLRRLAGLRRLEILSLAGTAVTDDGLQYLKELHGLKMLYLDDTQITDVGLAHLKGLTTLEHLSLYSTAATHDGLAELQRALPDCAIDREYADLE